MNTITIIGAGMMGSAMSVPALDNGHTVRLVGTPLDREIISGLKKDSYHITLKRTLKGNISFHYAEEIPDMLKNTDLVLCGVSSFGVDWFAESVLPVLPTGATVLAITKGLHKKSDGTLEPFPLYFKGLRPDVSFNAVGGPCISFELADKIHTEVAFCGVDTQALLKVRKLFETDYYHISVTDDVAGIETAVALKNAYAMAVSLAIGLYTKNNPQATEKYNAQAGLFFAASKEMGALIKYFGGKDQALYFGIGDLYVTIFGGRTRRLGVLLGAGNSFDEALAELKGVTLESVAIIKTLGYHLSCTNDGLSAFPLMQHIYNRIVLNSTGPIPWESFCTEY